MAYDMLNWNQIYGQRGGTGYMGTGVPIRGGAMRQQTPEERARAARGEYEAISAQAPGGFGVPVEDTLKQALAYKMQGGMSDPEYTQARGRIMGGLGSALSRGARASGRAGFYSPHSAAQANQPAFQQAGGALAGLEASRAQLRSRSIGEALTAAGGLAPIVAREREAGQRGFGQLYRQRSAGRPAGSFGFSPSFAQWAR
jgi:hypothetical protein